MGDTPLTKGFGRRQKEQHGYQATRTSGDVLEIHERRYEELFGVCSGKIR
jgi:hypothetical protein